VAAPTLLLGGEEDNTTPIHPAPGGVGFSTIRQLLSHCELRSAGLRTLLVLEQPAVAAALIRTIPRRDA